MCIQNLMRRKARTLLTVLGVLIGCCSIVIMVSLGIGMKEAQDKMLSEMGDLTLITVTAPQGGKGKVKTDDNLVKQIKRLNGVEAVTPRKEFEEYSCRVIAGAGNRYVADWTTVAGLDLKEYEKMGYHLLDGKVASGKGEVMVGEFFAYNFRDTLRPEGSNMVDRWGLTDTDGGAVLESNEEDSAATLPDAFFDPLKEKIILEIETDNQKFQIPFTPVGVTKEDYGKGSETSEGIAMSLSDLQALLERVQGKKEKKTEYDSLMVKVTDISRVAWVEQEIKKMGCNTDSMESIRKPMEEEARQKQMMLGGLGAISLFVAALGITNTMIMSISERTREIGVMKALGCYLYDIRMLFLTEAGMIGMLGGVAGSVVSFLASLVINLVALGSVSPEHLLLAAAGGGDFSRISIIPAWLYGFAVLFSVFIGLASGYYPAERAVRVSALEAIRSE